MKKNKRILLLFLFCTTFLLSAFPACAQESDITVTVYNYRDIAGLAPFLEVRDFYNGVTTEDGSYSYHEGTSEDASVVNYPLVFPSGSAFSIFFNGAPGNGNSPCIVREFKFNGTDTIYVTQNETPGGVGSDMIDKYSIAWNGSSFTVDRLHTDGTRKVDVNYFQSEDGISSFYKETPESRPVPAKPLPPAENGPVFLSREEFVRLVDSADFDRGQEYTKDNISDFYDTVYGLWLVPGNYYKEIMQGTTGFAENLNIDDYKVNWTSTRYSAHSSQITAFSESSGFSLPTYDGYNHTSYVTADQFYYNPKYNILTITAPVTNRTYYYMSAGNHIAMITSASGSYKYNYTEYNFRTEDGQKSQDITADDFRQTYPDHFVNESKVGQEPDIPDTEQPTTPGKMPDILVLMNAYLAYSVSILTAVSKNPVLSFMLASSLVCICLYVLKQIKCASRDS